MKPEEEISYKAEKEKKNEVKLLTLHPAPKQHGI